MVVVLGDISRVVTVTIGRLKIETCSWGNLQTIFTPLQANAGTLTVSIKQKKKTTCVVSINIGGGGGGGWGGGGGGLGGGG